MTKPDSDTTLIATGLVVLSLGCALAWLPLGPIVAGLYLLWVGVSRSQHGGGQ